MAKKHISKINLMDIVIQGPYTSFTDKILETYLPLEFINKIIVSCWEGDRDYSILPESVQKDADRVKFVKSPQYEGYAGPANVNLQLTTCRAGVQETEAAYVAKFRSDQYILKIVCGRCGIFGIHMLRQKRFLSLEISLLMYSILEIGYTGDIEKQ